MVFQYAFMFPFPVILFYGDFQIWVAPEMFSISLIFKNQISMIMYCYIVFLALDMVLQYDFHLEFFNTT